MDSNKIYFGNCYELIKQVPDHSVDLIYTDVPYLMHMGKTTGFLDTPARNKRKEDIDPISNGFDMSILDEFCRVCKKIYCYIWCSKDQILPIGNYFAEKGCSFNILVWCKTNPIPFANNTFLPDIEYCLVCREEGTKLNNDISLKSKWYCSKTNLDDKNLYSHPTIKPLELVRRHILHSTLPGDLVLDPFVGSGTTAVACKELQRDFIGFEINEDYYKIAVDRLNGVSANGQMSLLDTDFEQLDLFETEE